MATTGQTINDRLNAVRYALVGQGLARTVCKATTEEILGPKKKHIDYLLACTNEPNVSTPQLANLLIERTQNTSWAVVFKALISIHHLMSFGNERFTQYLATSNHSFELAEFMDRTTPQGYSMSSFVRNYAKYINDKVISYRTLAIDLCKIKSGNDNALRTMNMDNLGKTLPIVQKQFDSLLEFAAEPKDLNNGIITSAFRLLYKDLVRLYVAYQEAIINLLERYFKLSRRKTREALEMYKNYLARMDKVAGFLRVVEAVGLDKSEMPDLTKSPASILKLLEQHLAQLEAKKRGTAAASPEQDEGDDISQNKENKDPSSTTAAGEVSQPQPERPPEKEKEQTPTSAAAPKTSATALGPSRSESQPPERPTESATAPAAPKKASPPARPVTSPKVSQHAVAPEPAPAPTPTPATGSMSQTGEKKAPPERPAKPPLRPPPPPSAAGAAAKAVASSAASSPATSSSKRTDGQEAPAGASGAAEAASATAAARSPTPPPHPPPPESHHAPAPAPAPAPSHATGNATIPEPPASGPQQRPPPPTSSSQQVSSGVAAADAVPEEGATASTADSSPSRGQVNHEPSSAGGVANHSTPGHNDSGPLSCSAAAPQPAEPSTEASSTGQQAGAEVESVETNHVANNYAADEANDMPPPPPPIEDEQFDNHQQAAVEPDQQQEQRQQPGQGADEHQQQPVNGDHAGAADAQELE